MSALLLGFAITNSVKAREQSCISVPAFGPNFVVFDTSSNELINIKNKKRLRVPGLYSGSIMEWTDLGNGQSLITNGTNAFVVSHDLRLQRKVACQFAVMRNGHLMVVQELPGDTPRYNVRWKSQRATWALQDHQYITGISSNGRVLKVVAQDDSQVLYSISSDLRLIKLFTYVPRFSQAGIGFLEQLADNVYVAGHQDATTSMEVNFIRNRKVKRLFGMDAFDQMPMIFRSPGHVTIIDRWQYPIKDKWFRGTTIHTVNAEGHWSFEPIPGTKALQVSGSEVIALVKRGNRAFDKTLVPRERASLR